MEASVLLDAGLPASPRKSGQWAQGLPGPQRTYLLAVKGHAGARGVLGTRLHPDPGWLLTPCAHTLRPCFPGAAPPARRAKVGRKARGNAGAWGSGECGGTLSTAGSWSPRVGRWP